MAQYVPRNMEWSERALQVRQFVFDYWAETGPWAQPPPGPRGHAARAPRHRAGLQGAPDRHRDGRRPGLAQLRHPQDPAVLGLPEPGGDVHRRGVPQLHRLRARGGRGVEHAAFQGQGGAAGVVLRVLSRADHVLVEGVHHHAVRAGRPARARRVPGVGLGARRHEGDVRQREPRPRSGARRAVRAADRAARRVLHPRPGAALRRAGGRDPRAGTTTGRASRWTRNGSSA